MLGIANPAAPWPEARFPCFGAAVQLGHVVRDIRDAMRIWTATFRVGPFVLVEDVRLDEASYHGVPTDIRLSVALSYIGELQIELIQQLNEAPSPYRDFIARGLEGLQHIAFWPADFDGACGHLTESGLGPVYSVRPAGQAKPTLYFSDPGGLGTWSR